MRQCRRLLDKGFFSAASVYLHLCGEPHFTIINIEYHAEEGCDNVDNVGSVYGEDIIHVEVKSHSVMKRVGDSLPARGFKLKWHRNQPLVVPKILQKVST